MKEQWKECCEGYYEVSNLGRIRRAKPGLQTWPGRHIKTFTVFGYPVFNVFIPGRRKMRRVHQLVAAAFIGPCPQGHEVNHKDGVKANNHVTNLEYVTSSENTLHSFRTGLQNTKFPQSTIDRVRSMHRDGMSVRQIVDATGVSNTYCRVLVKGLWRNQEKA